MMGVVIPGVPTTDGVQRGRHGRLPRPVLDEDLEPLEEAARLGALELGVPDPDLGPGRHPLQPVPQGRRERKRHERLGRLERPQEPEAPVMGASPDSLKLVSGRLPLVELALPDAPPALETAHDVPPFVSAMACLDDPSGLPLLALRHSPWTVPPW